MIIRKPAPVQPDPQLGDFKITWHFAWLPIRSSDGLIWLERYKKIWEFAIGMRCGTYPPFIPMLAGEWELGQVKRINK